MITQRSFNISTNLSSAELDFLVRKCDPYVQKLLKKCKTYSYTNVKLQFEFTTIKIYSCVLIDSDIIPKRSSCEIPLEIFYKKHYKLLKKLNYIQYYSNAHLYTELQCMYNQYLESMGVSIDDFDGYPLSTEQINLYKFVFNFNCSFLRNELI